MRNPATTFSDRDLRAERPSDDQRRAVAEAAARILEHQGHRDFALARRKAGALFGIRAERWLPSNEDIETALRERQRLFGSERQPGELAGRRQAALAAMDFLRDFEPRLVGPVLAGTADAHSPVCLHLFADDELVLAEHLAAAGIDYVRKERRVRGAEGSTGAAPLFLLDADGIAFELMLFDLDGVREAPVDPVTSRPQQRATIRELRALLASAQ